ncbi:MAG: D-glycero-beta-D-manno-heptose-7-phosphate kinase [Chlorobiaceae bacterium]|nr:D-glycero-beta-D-manno-heptose-7-phosphate kinase [Chlorobiaceae bacterium]NTV61788.1 D-glycero-beta-D-manno-heptose-7-phosphate kinase [Chlorobiaceae bacterium]
MSDGTIATLLDSFSSKRIAIVGDIMLDKYIFGHVSRISPEYPVPVVDVTREDYRLGGAANVALNTLSLGADTVLVGITGDDIDRETLLGLFRRMGLSVECILSDPSRPTTCKTRVLSQNHHIVRVDFEKRHDVDEQTAEAVLGSIIPRLQSLDAIVLEDYNKGLLSERLITEIIAEAKKHRVPVLVDPKHRNFFAYRGCSLFKPNLSEMAASLGIAVPNEDIEVEKACLLLQEKIGADSIVVTRSEKGMTVFDGSFTHIAATSLDVSDVSGAGDTVIGLLALGVASRMDLVTNASIANLAAASVCQEVGAVPVKPDKLLRVCQEYLRR